MPLALKLMMQFLGSNFFNGTFIEVIHIYSLTLIDCWHLRILIHELYRDNFVVRNPYTDLAMVPNSLFGSDFNRISYDYIMERIKLRVKQSRP